MTIDLTVYNFSSQSNGIRKNKMQFKSCSIYILDAYLRTAVLNKLFFEIEQKFENSFLRRQTRSN